MSMDDASIADHQTFNAQTLHVGAGGLSMDNVKFGGPVDLTDAQVSGQMSMGNASIADHQTFRAQKMHVGAGGLFMRNVKFGGPVDLTDAQVGQMTMDDASIADHQTFRAQRMHVGAGGLFMKNVKFGGPVDLTDAQVSGQMSMDNASIADHQTFNAQTLHVGAGGLSMDNVKFGGPVDLTDAHVDGVMDMFSATIADQIAFDAQRLHTGELLMRSVKFGGPVDLTSAHVDDQMDMEGSSIADQTTFEGQLAHVGTGGLLMRSVKFGGTADFTLLTVDGQMDLRDSHVRRLDLGGAVVSQDLIVGGRRASGIEQWLHWDACDGPSPCLNLRNTRVGNLQDYERAWPAQITLEGFVYNYLGGIGGGHHQDIRNRPISWWRDWLSCDPVYSSQPYTHLAGVLATAGNRDGAADIRFFGRDRERSELLRGCTWLKKLGLIEKLDDRPCGVRQWGPWLGMAALQVFVGYGIGDHTFRAAGWAVILALIGTVVLCFAPGVRGMWPVNFETTESLPRGPRQKSWLWCFGASLHMVLPLITISQEFSDFFNDPKRERLHAWQHVVFGVLAVGGWVLAGFVVAAFSGLIQS